MIRTLIVEESAVARLGLRSILDGHATRLEIDEAASSADLAIKLRERYYELIIVEPVFYGGCSGAALVKRVCESSPWSAVLVFTGLDELTFGVRAIRDGARGYLMKSATRDELRAAVKRVGSGQLYLSKALAAEFSTGMRKYDTRRPPHETFSKREFQVFSMAVGGMTAVESAQVLEMSLETIGAIKRRVMVRLQAATPHDLVSYAVAQGLTYECGATCSTLWSARFSQDRMERPAAGASLAAWPAPARRATQAGKSAAIIGREMP
jgi:DNA-binding NarL/FixJ family response regulator